MNKNVIAALLVSVFASAVAAESIKDIQVKGSGRIDPAVIQSYLRSKIGDSYDSQLINDDLKNLFATGLFSSISFSFEGQKLFIQVSENPILNEIAFEGMSAVPEDMVKKELHLESRQVFKKADVLKAVDILLQIYRAKGYFNARITPQIIERPENRLDLIFKIEEGAPTNISKINMVGNAYFDSVDLKSVIDSEESGALSFFQTNNVYDPNRVRVDEEKMRRLYLKNGFYDFKVDRSTVELLPNYEGFFLTYQLTEGAQYTVGKIALNNPFPSLDVATIMQEIPYVSGSVFNQESIEESLDKLNDYYAAQGYPFVQITPEFKKDDKNHTIEVTYNVLKAQKVFVEKIVIEGNRLTREHLIRDQLMISEGDPFNPVLVRRSIKNLRNLGLFEPYIATDKRQGSAPDKVILVLRVSERSFFSIMGGVSYGHKQGLAGNASVGHRNIKGTGIAGQLQTVFGANTQSLNLSMLKPSMVRDLDFSIAGNVKHDEDKEYSAYREFSYMGSPTLTFNWTENFRTAVDYTFKRYETDFFEESQRNMRNLQYGDRKEDRHKSAASVNMIYDTRDDRFTPTEGFKASGSLEYSGIGGNVDYVKLDVAGDYYVPFGRSGMVLAFKGAFGKMWETNSQYINFFERYRLGYLSFRGFQVAGLGPREQMPGMQAAESKNTGAKNPFNSNGTGGLNMYKVTTEFSFPFAADVGVRALTFVDVGSVWGLGTPKAEARAEDPTIVGNGDMKTRVSIGFGIQVDIPMMGRLIVGLAKPLVKEEYDQEECFFFTLGGGM
jgi:outer membrane protein insertion porin family